MAAKKKVEKSEKGSEPVVEGQPVAGKSSMSRYHLNGRFADPFVENRLQKIEVGIDSCISSVKSCISDVRYIASIVQHHQHELPPSEDSVTSARLDEVERALRDSGIV